MNFSFGRANLRKLVSLPLVAPAYLISVLVPRDPRLWVFGRAGFFGDNPRYLMEHFTRHHPDIRCVWLASTRAELEQARRAGMSAQLKFSLAGWRLAFRASVGVVGLGLNDVNRVATGGMAVVQLWHGAPIKRIGLDSPVTFRTVGGPLGAMLEKVTRCVYRFTARRYLLVTAGSTLVQGRLMSGFGLPGERVRVTGDPRADVVLGHRGRTEVQDYRVRMRERLGVADGQRIVLYAPTWRDGGKPIPPPSDEERRMLTRVLEEAGAVLLLRSHPSGGLASDSHDRASRIVHMPAGSFPDMNFVLPSADVLVTDYSSAVIDFALLDRPVIFHAPDEAEYRASRGLYEDYTHLTGGKWSRDWGELSVLLAQCLTGDAEPFLATARCIASRYLSYRDTRNCQRVAQTVLELVRPEGRRAP